MNTRPNPYVGPRSFQPGEPFFGRDREVRSLAALLVAERIILLHSPSGAGKSSLVQAGLLPRLVEEDFNVLPTIRVNQEPPDLPGVNRYALSAMLSLEEGIPEPKRLPLRELSALTLDDYLTRRFRAETAPASDVLIFDQFEEVLTIAPVDRDSKQAFFEQLGLALRNKNRWALFAIREDYLGALAPYTRPIPGRFSATFRLDLLGVDGALQAIQKPPQTQGVEFIQSAAQKLVDDLRRTQVQLPDGSLEEQLGPSVEPVQLQVVCFRLWQGLAEDDNDINETDLAGVGDVNQSLADYYAASVKNVAEKANTRERSIREWFDRKLITPDGIRGQVLMGAETSDGLPNSVVRLLEDAHIIRGEKRAGKTWYELSHDRMLKPVREDNTTWFEHNLSVLQRQAAIWNQQGRSEGLLLRGKEFQHAAREVKNLDLTKDEFAFWEASKKLNAQEQLRRRLVTGMAVLLVFATLALLISFWTINQSEARRVTALGQTALAQGDKERATLLALQSLKLADLLETHVLLFDIANQSDKYRDRFSAPADVNALAWSADGRLASGLSDSTVIIWDLKTGQPAQTLKGHNDQVTSVAWAADGQLASGSYYDGAIIIWDTASGKPDQTLEGHYVMSVAWSADGWLASTNGYGADIWNLQTGQVAQYLFGDLDSSATSIAWATNGQLAAGFENNAVVIWNIPDSGEYVHPTQILKGHNASVTSVAWSADGRLASGSRDGKVILWNTTDGKPAQTLTLTPSSLIPSQNKKINVAWLTDDFLAIGHGNEIFIASNPDTYIHPCQWVFRNFTFFEWKDILPFYVYDPACPNLPADNATKSIPSFLLWTNPGRTLMAGVILLIIFTVWLTITKSAGFVLVPIGFGMFFLFVPFTEINNTAAAITIAAYATMILTLAFWSLPTRFVLIQASWVKIGISLGLALGITFLILFWGWYLSIGYSSMQPYLFYGGITLFAGSLLVWALWGGYLLVRRIIRAVGSKH